ncbi:MAG: O-methyltransferase [Muribaculaceae bacterium]
MSIVEDQLEEYILQHIDEEPSELAHLDRETHLYHLRPRMCSGHLQGRLLKMFVRMIAPKMVLELGTFTGYSAMCLAEGLIAPDAHVHTIEIDDELEDFIRMHLATSPMGERITLHIGDACNILQQMQQTQFDLVFIDANKRNYVDYYRLALPHVRKGGFIIADNTLWDGKVIDWGKKLDDQTRGILEFNDLVAADKSVEKVILPLRDGLTIIYKK